LRLILDSSSTISLHNGGLLKTVLQLTSTDFVFHIGTVVRDECGDLRQVLDQQSAEGRLVILPGNTLTAAQFNVVLELYELGLGETECIALAEQQSLVVCTDDKAARKAAIQHLGKDRAVGSLRLIRECVCARHITTRDAFACYETMKSRGAFLPDIVATYFDC
jgi:predicted nucleic acid-binding protein